MYKITRFLVGVARQLGIPLRRPVQIPIRVPVPNYISRPASVRTARRSGESTVQQPYADNVG